MAVFAISDLHLSTDNPSKAMDVFGDRWKDYTNKIEKNWRKIINIQLYVPVIAIVQLSRGQANGHIRKELCSVEHWLSNCENNRTPCSADHSDTSTTVE